MTKDDFCWGKGIAIAAGQMVAHWLIAPLLFEWRTFHDGFWVGVISAILVLLMWAVVRYFIPRKENNAKMRGDEF